MKVTAQQLRYGASEGQAHPVEEKGDRPKCTPNSSRHRSSGSRRDTPVAAQGHISHCDPLLDGLHKHNLEGTNICGIGHGLAGVVQVGANWDDWVCGG